MLEQFDTNRWLKKFELQEFPEPEIVPLNHPILLCHGYGAIASLVKPSPLYDVAMLMRSHNVLAFAPNIVPYAKIETRAESWVKLVEELSKKTPDHKINIIAHSMGGLDMRYALVNFDIEKNVQSFTTISTPHRGSSLAELTLKTPEAIRDKLADFLDWIGNHMYPQTKSNSVGSAEQLTRKYITEVFNPDVPDLPGIPYYSYSGAVGKGTDNAINVLSRFQNNHVFEQEGINDGMISVKSSKWGHHIKTCNLSHLEQMNMRVKNDKKEVYRNFWLDVLKMLASEGH